ncbi:Rrf2 family transcriptional regulator [Lacticaseibacillus sp. N501-2]|uniref:Rrf2 family transcriptional regulator n=1 Tax=Lacticaseibacillus salsurae TaxID=3367729 RepID=UPI0038B2FC98
MKYSHKLSDAIHILAFVDIFQGGDVSSTAIAGSIESNPSLVRRLMAQLAKAGLLTTRPGISAATLARPADTISLLDVYQAIDDAQQLLHVDPQTNLACPVGRNIQTTLDGVYDRIQHAAEAQMADVSLAEIIQDLKTKIDA